MKCFIKVTDEESGTQIKMLYEEWLAQQQERLEKAMATLGVDEETLRAIKQLNHIGLTIRPLSKWQSI